MPEKSQIPISFQQSPFIGKVREGVVIVANFLVSDPFFLRSGHGQVMMFL